MGPVIFANCPVTNNLNFIIVAHSGLYSSNSNVPRHIYRISSPCSIQYPVSSIQYPVSSIQVKICITVASLLCSFHNGALMYKEILNMWESLLITSSLDGPLLKFRLISSGTSPFLTGIAADPRIISLPTKCSLAARRVRYTLDHLFQDVTCSSEMLQSIAAN